MWRNTIWPHAVQEILEKIRFVSKHNLIFALENEM